MHVLGDVYDIAGRVKAYDPSYELVWNPHLCQYQVLAVKRVLRPEGAYHGHPLFSMQDKREIVFTWDVKGMAPDMRILWHLYETDIWRYPGGPEKFYDDMVRDTEKKKQKREEKLNDEVQYVAGEYHPLVFDTKKSFDMGKRGA